MQKCFPNSAFSFNLRRYPPGSEFNEGTSATRTPLVPDARDTARGRVV
jgi:hypothetical protein